MTTSAQVAAGAAAVKIQSDNYRLGLTAAQDTAVSQAVANALDNRSGDPVGAIDALGFNLPDGQSQVLSDLVQQAFANSASKPAPR